MNYFILIFLLIFPFSRAFPQTTVSGKVYEWKENVKMPLPGASVSWLGTPIGIITDENGAFELSDATITDRRLIVRFVGYNPDTVLVGSSNSPIEIVLRETQTLGTVEIGWEREAVMISLNPIRTEILTSKELKKAACCNLGESFETNPSVDITIKDAVSGSKELQVLGLSGAYTQVLTENVPLIHGLGLTYGLNSVPGTLIDAIHIVKGPGSVIFGHESISGMINIDLKDPEKTDRFFVNGYLDQNLRKEINIDKAWKINRDLSTLLSLHADHFNERIDLNNDSFMDMPLLTTFNLLNKWKYTNGHGLISQHTVKYLHEDRKAGQLRFDFTKEADSSAYGQKLMTDRVEIYGRTGYVIPAANYKSIGMQYALLNHQQTGFYGFKPYAGSQKNALIRLIYNQEWIKNNSLNTGFSYQYDHTDEHYDTLHLARIERKPGFFAENTLQYKTRLTIITGLRTDYLNESWYVTPRANIRYSLREETFLRVSAGTGFRNAYILAENPAVLSGSRQVVIKGPLMPEKAVNLGINFDHAFKFAYRKGSLALDAYRTIFSNKIIPDLDSDPSKAIFSNLSGKAYADNFQAEGSYRIFKPVELKLAYKFLDVTARLDDGSLIRQPYIAKHRILGTIFYESFNRKWNANLVGHWFGTKKLPRVHVHHAGEDYPEYSPSYTVFNAQLTRKLKNMEIYTGVENILNFTQEQHILGAEDPYGPDFDTSYIWGPLEGRKIYIGFRYLIK